VFAETQTLGIRRWVADRSKLRRMSSERMTRWGAVQGKRVELPDGTVRFFPEYEDCRRLAQAHKIPLQQVMDAAREVRGE
jgi:uncharacterized protein (DUF111 family)